MSYRKRKSSCPLAPPPQWWEEVLPQLLKEWAATGAYLGFQRTAGRRRAQVSLVVQTLHKAPPKRGSGISRVPSQIRWKDGRLGHSMPTDVVQCDNRMELQAGTVFGPGDRARHAGAFATIGAAVSHPQLGRCLLTAGHLLPRGTPLGTPVDVIASDRPLPTRLIGHARSGSVDFALLEPSSAAPLDNLVMDVERIGPVYIPTELDVGAPVRVVRQDGSFCSARCEGVQHHFFGDDGVFYANVILVTNVTSAGDSGGALVGAVNGLWGFLLGRRAGTYSAFVPAHMVLHSAGVTLA